MQNIIKRAQHTASEIQTEWESINVTDDVSEEIADAAKNAEKYLNESREHVKVCLLNIGESEIMCEFRSLYKQHHLYFYR